MKSPFWASHFIFAAFLGMAVCQAAAAVDLPEEFTQTDTEERQLLRSAASLFASQNYPAAAGQYRKFVDRFGRSFRAPEAQMMLAECLYRQSIREAGLRDQPSEKVFADAKGEFTRALRMIARDDHLSEGAAFRLGEIEFNLRNYEEAIRHMQRLQSDHPAGLLRGESRLLQAQSLLALRRVGEAYPVLKTALADQPATLDDPRMQLTYGIALFEIGNSSEALRYLEKLTSVTAHLYAARAYLHLGKPLVAIGRLRSLIDADPQGPSVELAQYLLAESFFASKDYPSAISAYEQFLRSYPRSPYKPASMYKIGLCQFEREEYLAARGSFQSVLQLAPRSEFAELSLYMIGESFMKEGRLKEANLAYADMAGSFQSPLAGNAYFKQGWTHYRQNELTAAEASLRMMLAKHGSHPLAPAAAFLIGNVLTHQQRYRDAVTSYQRALDMLENSQEPDEKKVELREACLALLNRANLLAGDHASLVSGYQYVLGHVKPTLNIWRAATLLHIAEGHFRQGQFDQALGLYREIANSYPASPESALAVDGAAWCLFAKGDFAAAERERTKLAAQRGRPGVAASQSVLAEGKLPERLFVANEFEQATSLFNQKKYLEALDAYERFENAYRLDPLAPEAALQAGWCYYRLEHYGQALKAWERVETSYPDSPAAAKAAWATADTYFRAAQSDKAVASYRRILQVYPRDPAVGYARLRIAQSFYNAKDTLRAISAFEELALGSPEAPESAQALDFLTQLLLLPESKTAALDALTRIADANPASPGGVAARLRIAKYLYESGDYSAAAQNFEPLISRLSDKNELMEAVFAVAESYYQLKRYKDASLAYERFTANYAGDKRFAAALFHLGASRFKLEQFAEAAQAFEQLARQFPSTQFAPVALFNSALAYRKLGQWEPAARALKAYIQQYPTEAKNSNAVGELTSLYQEHRRFAESTQLLSSGREALPADDPRRLEWTHQLAEDYAAMGEEAKAMEEYRRAAAAPAKGNSYRLSALAKLGEYYEKSQRWSEALEAYQDLAKNAADPQWVEAAKARAQTAREKLAQASLKVSSHTANQPSSGSTKERK